MAHITPVDRSELPEFEFIFDQAEKALGAVPNSMLTMGHQPGILGAFSLFFGSVLHRLKQPQAEKSLKLLSSASQNDPENQISPQLAQLVGHVCSLASGCRYCQAHTAEAAALMRVPEDKITSLVDFENSDAFDDAERAALKLAFAAGRVPNESTPAHFEELKKHFNEKQIVDLVAVIALFGFLNRWNDTMATALEEAPRHFAEKNLAAAGWEVGKHA